VAVRQEHIRCYHVILAVTRTFDPEGARVESKARTGGAKRHLRYRYAFQFPTVPWDLVNQRRAAQQFDIRLQQFCYWPLQYITVRQRKDDWGGATNSHPDYIRFYNSLWLVANDIIIGIALGSYIIENAGVVAQSIDYYLKVCPPSTAR
jgi:hypothetical protein